MTSTKPEQLKAMSSSYIVETESCFFVSNSISTIHPKRVFSIMKCIYTMKNCNSTLNSNCLLQNNILSDFLLKSNKEYKTCKAIEKFMKNLKKKYIACMSSFSNEDDTIIYELIHTIIQKYNKSESDDDITFAIDYIYDVISKNIENNLNNIINTNFNISIDYIRTFLKLINDYGAYSIMERYKFLSSSIN